MCDPVEKEQFWTEIEKFWKIKFLLFGVNANVVLFFLQLLFHFINYERTKLMPVYS